MGKSKRQWYEVRVRDEGVKKSKFYLEVSSQAAAQCYKGDGFVMWVEKLGKERSIGRGIGSFFKLGDDLLKEFARTSSLTALEENRDKEKVKNRRGYYERQRKETTD